MHVCHSTDIDIESTLKHSYIQYTTVSLAKVNSSYYVMRKFSPVPSL